MYVSILRLLIRLHLAPSDEEIILPVASWIENKVEVFQPLDPLFGDV